MYAYIIPAAFANPYEAMEGAKTALGDQIGIGGSITVKDPKVSPTGFSNHRDYMLFVNIADVRATVGAGYFTADGSTFWDMVYSYPNGGFPNHDIYNTIPLGTKINAQAKAQNDDPTTHCWVGFAYNTPFVTKCFSNSKQAGASNIGAIARTFSSHSTNNDLYGYMSNLQSRFKTSSGTVGWETFSNAAMGTFKCWSSASGNGGSYVISYQPSTNPTKNNIGTGPRFYTSDSCQSPSPDFDPYGENAVAGGN